MVRLNRHNSLTTLMEVIVIKFTVQISIPGYLDAEDELSNLLQGEGEEEELRRGVKRVIRNWIACWMPHVSPNGVRVKIEQE